MTFSSSPATEDDLSHPKSWLETPLSGVMCALSWLVATAIFVGAIALLGGPTENDAGESLYSTWAVAHGSVTCTYPPVTAPVDSFLPDYRPGPYVPPFWVLLSGGLESFTQIGHTAPFPSAQELGARCDDAYQAMYQWAGRTLSEVPTIGLGYVSWLILLAGLVAVIRASGCGRRRSEAVAVVLVAATPIVWQPLLDQYHPQDLCAMGLILGGIACSGRRRWVWAGILLGLAVLSQQFALLVLVPLLVVAPPLGRLRMFLAALGTGAVVALPLIGLTAGRAFSAVVLGTGDYSSFGGTVLWELRLHGPLLVFASRLLPIIVSVLLAWWVRDRIGGRVLEPVPLLSLLTICLSLRLVFEQGLFGYKFLALAVMLIVLEVGCGHIRGELIAWIALVTLAFNPVPYALAFNARPWGLHLAASLAGVFMVCALLLIAWDAVHREVRWYLVAFFVFVACAFGQWPLWTVDAMRPLLPLWMWQLVLLSTGIALAAGPLVRQCRDKDSMRPMAVDVMGHLAEVCEPAVRQN